MPLARTGTPASAADACAPLTPGTLTGRVALIRRGTCSFYQKVKNAEAAGAIGVVVYNNAAGLLQPSVVPPAGSPPVVVPVVGIQAADGVEINNRIAGGPTSMTWTTLVLSLPNSAPGLASGFSSYGPSPDLDIKPDIAAPGGAIRSTFPIELGSYAILSGTSMSTPHAAGAIALLLEARPRTPAQTVRDILQNSADPLVWWGNPALGLLDNVHRQGAGLLDIDDAILAPVKIEPGKLPLGEGAAGPATRRLRIENKGPSAVTLALSHAPALATGPNTFTPAFFSAFASVSFGSPSVTVPAGGEAEVEVTIAAPPAPDRGLYGGYIVLTGGGRTYRVPYMGFIGDYQSIPVLVPTRFNFPWLARQVGTSFVNQPSGATFTLQPGDLPQIVFHLDHPVRRGRMEVFDADTGRAWHRALESWYFPRNSGPETFFAFAWDGTTSAGRRLYSLPDGRYVIRLSVQKALGEDDNPAHWETWTSPVITIDRP
jgi:hypothetical protein